MIILAVISLLEFLHCVHYPWHLLACLRVSAHQRTDILMRWIAEVYFALFAEMLPVRLDLRGLSGLRST